MRAHGLIALVLPLAACEQQLTPLENFSCGDCPSPGRHFDVGVDVVLYRVAE